MRFTFLILFIGFTANAMTTSDAKLIWLKSSCLEAVDGEMEKSKNFTISLEAQACNYIAERGDLVPGFKDRGRDSMTFLNRCNKI